MAPCRFGELIRINGITKRILKGKSTDILAHRCAIFVRTDAVHFLALIAPLAGGPVGIRQRAISAHLGRSTHRDPDGGF